jgi:hypothetical protein
MPYLPKVYDFRDGKLWPNDRAGMLLNQRPDGSFTNWSP